MNLKKQRRFKLLHLSRGRGLKNSLVEKESKNAPWNFHNVADSIVNVADILINMDRAVLIDAVKQNDNALQFDPSCSKKHTMYSSRLFAVF